DVAKGHAGNPGRKNWPRRPGKPAADGRAALSLPSPTREREFAPPAAPRARSPDDLVPPQIIVWTGPVKCVLLLFDTTRDPNHDLRPHRRHRRRPDRSPSGARRGLGRAGVP